MHDPSFPNSSTLEATQAAQAHADDIANALTVSELRYRRLFEAARDGILILDSETDRITDANPFMAELLGYPREEFIGKETVRSSPRLKSRAANNPLRAMGDCVTRRPSCRRMCTWQWWPLAVRQPHWPPLLLSTVHRCVGVTRAP